VKVINHYGDEVLKVYECRTTTEGSRWCRACHDHLLRPLPGYADRKTV